MSSLSPIQIVELSQPRCSLRFGAFPCGASLTQALKRTNIALYSEQFDNALWIKFGATVSANSTADPLGLTTADTITEDTSTGGHRVSQTISFTAGTVYTFSVFLKAGTLTQARITLPLSAFGANIIYTFDLTTGATVGSGGSPTAFGFEDVGNGWRRFYVTKAATVTGTGTPLIICVLAGSVSYLGAGRTMFAWGAQVEAGDTVSEYKPTTNVAVGKVWGGAAAKCYNTYSTCNSKPNFKNDGRIRWRFVNARPGVFFDGAFADPDDVATNAIPVDGMTVSTSKSEINVAGILEGKSPFGIHATCSVSIPEFKWNDNVGDFYKADRASLPDRNFWAVWTARNKFYGGMEITIHDGYEGQALSAMRQRRYILDNVNGPVSGGGVTLNGVDPLMLAEGTKSLFPEAMDVKLEADITSSQTSFVVITNDETYLSKAYGISDYPGLIIGTEIMLYGSYTVIEPGRYTINAAQRGVLKSTAKSAKANARVQRIGYYQDVPTWECGQDLLVNHTPMSIDDIDAAEWLNEGSTYLTTLRSTAVIPTPTAVSTLMGETCQQGMFFCWWDEYAQSIRMQAVRPPRGEVQLLTYDNHIVADSVTLTREPESALTRVFVYYDQVDYTKTDKPNFLVVNGQVETENEAAASGGTPRTLEVTARWVNTEAHAQQIITRILSRYRDVPRFLSIHVSAKDRLITVGDVLDITAREIVDSEGRLKSDRWQVISWAEVKAGEVYALDLQTFELIGRFAVWMADDAPDFELATDAQKALGAWWSDDDGLMPDGTDGYQWQ